MIKSSLILCHLAHLFVVSESSPCTQWNYDYTIYPLQHVDTYSWPTNQSPDTRITCSNVSGDILLDYGYEKRPFNQDLFIVNSTISKLPGNSSLVRFTQLRTLYLKKLQIEEISPGAFNGMTIENELDLGNNKLKKISNGVFNNLEKLQLLDLSRNLINEIEEDSFLGLTDLKTLYLNENRITVLTKKLFKDFKKLETLWVSHNPLKEFPTGISLPSLNMFLDLGSNLKTFDTDLSNNHMDTFTITDGQLEEVDFAKFPRNIIRIQLDRNKITSVQNWDKLNCEFVFLDENKIPELQISDDVVILYMMKNAVKSVVSIDSNRPKKLKYLDLSFNEIVNLNYDSFRKLESLATVILHHNKIETVHENTFLDCKELRKVDLSFNKVGIIEANAFKGPNGIFINLAHNNLKSKSPGLIEVKHATVNLAENELSWEDLKGILGGNVELQVEITPESWVCKKNNDNSVFMIARYLKMEEVDQITCHPATK